MSWHPLAAALAAAGMSTRRTDRDRVNGIVAGGWTFAEAFSDTYKNPCNLGVADPDNPEVCVYCADSLLTPEHTR